MVRHIPADMPNVRSLFECVPPDEEDDVAARKSALPLPHTDSYDGGRIDARRTMAFDRWADVPPARAESTRSRLGAGVGAGANMGGIKVSLPSFRRKMERSRTLPSFRSTTEGTTATESSAPTATSSNSGGRKGARRRDSTTSARSVLRSAKHVVGRAVSVPAFVLLDIVGSLAGRR